MISSSKEIRAPKEILRVALVQSSLLWEEVEANLKNFQDRLESLENIDLVLLPEMFSTGFTMNPQPFASINREIVLPWMKEISKRMDFAICGSLCIEEGGRYFNRFFGCESGALKVEYSKRHLFSLAGEEKVYSAGTELKSWDIKGWNITPLICYDLRFPVWSRNNGETDLYLYVANWPERRISAWDALLKARAIENMAYVAAVNRVGLDANGIDHNGSSQVLGITGDMLASTEDFLEETLIVEIAHSEIGKKRERFGFLNDRDDFTLSLP